MDAQMQAAFATAVAAALAAERAAVGVAGGVHHVAFKMPDFWTKDPDLWFTQAEMAFDVARITRSYTKYQHIVAKLPEDVMLSCRSLLGEIAPTDDDAYERLRDRLTSTFGKTTWQRGFALLDHPDLGDRRPSTMMNQMLALLPYGTNPEMLFFCLFLRRLPASMRDQLASANHKTAAAMAEHADCIWDARAAKDVAAIADAAAELSLVAKKTQDSRRRSPSRDNRPRRSQTPARRRPTRRPDSRSRNANPDLCFYHDSFGKRAQKCEQPCAWTEN